MALSSTGTAPVASSRPGPLDRYWLALLARAARRLAVGRLKLVLPDGRVWRFAAPAEGPEGTVQLWRWRLARRFLTGGGMGFAESYVDGDWDSPDPAAVCALAAANRLALADTLQGPAWKRGLRRVLQAGRPNTRSGSRRNIAAHYDLGNAFYARWLDSSMAYSAGVFGDGVQSLEDAQRAKYARLADLLDVRAGHRVLEIGCGWGGFAQYLAAERGAHVTAVTISRAQYEAATARIARAGLAAQVEIRLQDYRDVAGEFDRIASVEMLEAVGERYWPVFFSALRARLAPGGRAALQVITIAESLFPSYRRNQDFIQRHIFPGGLLPSPAALAGAARRAGLWPRDWRWHGQDYAATLAHWQRRFQRAWPELAAEGGFDARFKRLWEFYLAYCRGGFQSGAINVVQVTLDPA